MKRLDEIDGVEVVYITCCTWYYFLSYPCIFPRLPICTCTDWI